MSQKPEITKLEILPELPKYSDQIQAFNFTETELLLQIKNEFYLFNYHSKKYEKLGIRNLTSNFDYSFFNTIDISPHSNTNENNNLNILCLYGSNTSKNKILISEITINKSNKNMTKSLKFGNKSYCYLYQSRSLLIGKHNEIIILVSRGESSQGMISILNLDNESIIEKNISKYLKIDKQGNGLVLLNSGLNNEFVSFGGMNMGAYDMYKFKYSYESSDIKFVRKLDSNNLKNLVSFGNYWKDFSCLVVNKNYVLVIGGFDGSSKLDVILLYDVKNNRWFKSDLKLPKKFSTCTSNNLVLKMHENEAFIHYFGGNISKHYKFKLPFSSMVKIKKTTSSSENESKENLDLNTLKTENEKYKNEIILLNNKIDEMKNEQNNQINKLNEQILQLKTDFNMKLSEIKNDYEMKIKELNNKLKQTKTEKE